MKHKILLNLKTPLCDLDENSDAWDFLDALCKECGHGISSYLNERKWRGTVKDALLDLSEQLKELKQ